MLADRKHWGSDKQQQQQKKNIDHNILLSFIWMTVLVASRLTVKNADAFVDLKNSKYRDRVLLCDLGGNNTWNVELGFPTLMN